MISNVVCMTYGALKLCVDVSLGGHIVEFSVNDQNALATNRTVIGSTFWPSPQDSWGWPPLPTLDNQPYNIIEKSEKELLLTSGVCKTTGLQVQKRFWFEDDHLKVGYTMINTTDKPMKYAPWEITRIHGGVTFYKSEDKPLAISTGETTQENGHVWHEYRPERQKSNEKIFGNGSSGWLANIHNGLLLVKSFERLSIQNTAPGESEIEIYGHGDINNAYIEMEQQGKYQVIEAKTSYQWQVSWFLSELPKKSDVRVGSTELVTSVEVLLRKHTK